MKILLHIDLQSAMVIYHTLEMLDWMHAWKYCNKKAETKANVCFCLLLKGATEWNQMKELLWFQVSSFDWNRWIVSTILISFTRLMRWMIHICAITHHRPHHHHWMLTVPMSAEIDDYRKRNEIESRMNGISREKINNRKINTMAIGHCAGKICNESEIHSLLKRVSVYACVCMAYFDCFRKLDLFEWNGFCLISGPRLLLTSSSLRLLQTKSKLKP